MTQTQSADVIVIGAGMAGVSAAARLAGAAKVIVLEAEPVIGHHATGRSAAMLIRNYGGDVARVLNDASAAFFRAPDVCEPILSPRAELMIATPEDLPILERYAADAVGLTRLSADEAGALCPILRVERLAGAVIEADAQAIDVDRMLQGFARHLRALGGQIVTAAPVTAMQHQPGGWQVETPQGRFAAPVVVNAAGAWADAVADLAGAARLGIQPLRRSAAILPAPEGQDLARWPMVVPASEGWYMKPMGGKLMVSPADEDPVAPHDAWPDDLVLAEGLHRFERAVTLDVTRVEQSWAGLRSFALDRVAVVGHDPATKGFFWLAGQGGTGIQTAPALAELSADLILGRSPSLPEATLAALSPARFQP